MKKLNKMIICLGTLLVFSMGFNFSDRIVHAQNNIEIANEDEDNGNIEEYKNAYVWKYKVVDGKLYKRKYNKVTGKWVGKWLPV